MKKSRGLVLLLISIILSTTIFAKGAEQKVNVMVLSGNTGLATVKMMEQAEQQKSRYNFQVFNNPNLLLGKIISGEADIAALPTNTAAILYNRGTEIQLASVIGWGVMYFVGSDTTIKKWTDLKGKGLGVTAKGAVPDLVLQYLLKQNGIDPEKDVKLNYVASPIELAQLVIAGKIALAALPEPWVTEVLVQSPKNKVLLDFQKEWGRIQKQEPLYPQSCIVVNRKLVERNPLLVKEFLKELESSIDWIQRNSKQGGILAEKYVQVSRIAVEKGLQRCNLKYSLGFEVKAEVDSFLKVLNEVAPAATGGKLPDAGFYYQP